MYSGPNRVQKCAKAGEIKSREVNTAFNPASLHGVVNLRENAVFTFFALYLTLVCNFCTKFGRCKFGVNQYNVALLNI